MAIIITSKVNTETWEDKNNRLAKDEREGTNTPTPESCYHQVSVVWNPMWDGPIEEYRKNPKFTITEV